ncbi:hypothetical protein AB3X93_05135 [Paraburkholderia sp. BR14262]|uniref:hypothetical protein n=1 Tax=unclassified Paraburkholderia TaxID=2615204 RepID=UPI0034CD7104
MFTHLAGTPPFETHSTCFGDWLAFEKQARRRFQEKRPFAALHVQRAGAVPEPACRLLRLGAEDVIENCMLTAAQVEPRGTPVTSSSWARAP